MFSFQQQKNNDTCNETGKCDPYTARKQLIETAFGWSSTLDLAEKHLNAAIINMSKELKESMPKNLKSVIISQLIDNIN